MTCDSLSKAHGLTCQLTAPVCVRVCVCVCVACAWHTHTRGSVAHVEAGKSAHVP